MLRNALPWLCYVAIFFWRCESVSSCQRGRDDKSTNSTKLDLPVISMVNTHDRIKRFFLLFVFFCLFVSFLRDRVSLYLLPWSMAWNSVDQSGLKSFLLKAEITQN